MNGQAYKRAFAGCEQTGPTPVSMAPNRDCLRGCLGTKQSFREEPVSQLLDKDTSLFFQPLRATS